MVGGCVIIVGHCWCCCNYSRPWLVLVSLQSAMVGVGVIIVDHGWCWCNYRRPWLVLV